MSFRCAGRCAGTLLLVLCAACAPESPPPPIPSIQCVPRAVGAAGLESEWQPLAAHILACVVVDPAGTPALEILTVSAQSLYDARPRDPTTLDMPQPLILLPGGRLAGRLPHGYPDDPPRATTLEFSQWQAGLPKRIGMRVSEPTGEHEVVMLWDAATSSYTVAAMP